MNTPATAAGTGTQVRTLTATPQGKLFPQFLVTPIPFRAVKAHYNGTRGFWFLSTTCPHCLHKGTGLVAPDNTGDPLKHAEALARFESMIDWMQSDSYKCRRCERMERQMQHADHKHYCDVHGLNEGTVMQHA